MTPAIIWDKTSRSLAENGFRVLLYGEWLLVYVQLR
jgi:hypothetical protein